MFALPKCCQAGGGKKKRDLAALINVAPFNILLHGHDNRQVSTRNDCFEGYDQLWSSSSPNFD